MYQFICQARQGGWANYIYLRRTHETTEHQQVSYITQKSVNNLLHQKQVLLLTYVLNKQSGKVSILLDHAASLPEKEILL